MIDIKRTIEAKQSQDEYPYGESVFLEPGLCWSLNHMLGFTCPGCGCCGAISVSNPPKQEKSWLIVSGDLSNPTKLTLSPSIHCISCCGWHGHLTNGIFVSC